MDRILVVEDDVAVQKALLRTFESSGFEVTIVSDGATAMNTFAATDPLKNFVPRSYVQPFSTYPSPVIPRECETPVRRSCPAVLLSVSQ